MNRKHYLALSVVVVAAIAAPAALAAENNGFDRIVDLYRNGAANWEAPLLKIAMALFGILVGIEFSWAMIRTAMKGGDMADFMAEIVNQVMYIGFFSFLMLNSSSLAHAVIDSFRQAGDIASSAGGGTAGVRPSDMFETGLNLATMVFKASLDTGLTGIGQSVALMISAVVLLICFALIGAFMIIALVESYMITSAGVIMMGFAGSRFTKDYAVKTMTYAVSVGAKLFMLQLIAGLGEGILKNTASAATVASIQSPEEILTILGFAIVMLVLTKSVPDQVQSLISGSSPSGSGNMLAAAAGAAVGGAVAAATGGAAAVGGAFKLASAQLAGQGAGGGAPSFAQLGMKAMGNLGNAAAQDFGGRLAGHGRHGSQGGRMGHSMAREARELQREAARPMMSQAAPAQSQGAETQAAGSIRPEGGAQNAASAPNANQGPAGAPGGSGAEGNAGEAKNGQDGSDRPGSGDAAGATPGAGGDKSGDGQSDTVTGASDQVGGDHGAGDVAAGDTVKGAASAAATTAAENGQAQGTDAAATVTGAGQGGGQSDAGGKAAANPVRGASADPYPVNPNPTPAQSSPSGQGEAASPRPPPLSSRLASGGASRPSIPPIADALRPTPNDGDKGE